VIELTLTHDGRNWVARNDELSAKAPTLKALDQKLKRLVKEKGYLRKEKRIDVFMAFDNAALPRWMHQHSAHYFNRVLQVKDEDEA
jgi:hypothetical protein